VLRDGAPQEYKPQPDVAAICGLVEDVRASGLDVDLLVEGVPQPLPAAPQLAAYRIVQESLTNVLKHAGPASRTWVRLHWRPDALELSILDDGRGASAAIVTANGDGDGDGQGILGMQHRARLHGGRLEAGPRQGGGFGVHAAIPYAPSSPGNLR
jgi:signal transduction histidine kinase